jgi:hypothetical protein
VEKDHRTPHQQEGEVIDLYKCTFCGQEVHLLVVRSPYCLYD